jgi:hypothetical protein
MPGIPRAMVLTAYSTLFPAIGLFVTVAGRNAEHCRQLDVSVETSEPRGFVVRLACARLSHRSVHRIPHPTSVTIAKRPFERARDANRNIPVSTPPSSLISENPKWISRRKPGINGLVAGLCLPGPPIVRTFFLLGFSWLMFAYINFRLHCAE